MRRSSRDRSALYDLLALLLESTTIWTLDVALEASSSAHYLAGSSHPHHVQLASKSLKFVLVQFRQIIKENLEPKVKMQTTSTDSCRPNSARLLILSIAKRGRRPERGKAAEKMRRNCAARHRSPPRRPKGEKRQVRLHFPRD